MAEPNSASSPTATDDTLDRLTEDIRERYAAIAPITGYDYATIYRTWKGAHSDHQTLQLATPVGVKLPEKLVQLGNWLNAVMRQLEPSEETNDLLTKMMLLIDMERVALEDLYIMIRTVVDAEDAVILKAKTGSGQTRMFNELFHDHLGLFHAFAFDLQESTKNAPEGDIAIGRILEEFRPILQHHITLRQQTSVNLMLSIFQKGVIIRSYRTSSMEPKAEPTPVESFVPDLSDDVSPEEAVAVYAGALGRIEEAKAALQSQLDELDLQEATVARGANKAGLSWRRIAEIVGVAPSTAFTRFDPEGAEAAREYNRKRPPKRSDPQS